MHADNPKLERVCSVDFHLRLPKTFMFTQQKKGKTH